MGKYSLRRRKIMTGYLFILPFVVFMLVTNTGPVVYGFVKSFFSWSLSGGSHFVGFDIYRSVFADDIFWNSLKNTGLFYIISVPVEITIALFLAVLFSYNINNKFKTIFKSIYFLPVITSFVAAAFVWKWIYNSFYGPLDQFLVRIGLPKIMFLTNSITVIPSISVVQIWMRIGFVMIIFLAGLEGIPRTYYEAAMVDGASRWKVFSKITLPLLNPQLIMVFIFETISVMKIFDLPYIMTNGGPAGRSRSIVLHIYETSFTMGRIDKGLAMAVILFVIIMIINVVQWKIIRRTIEY
ncbi:MAG: carbohydrate ABC transporter permease [Candidatus Humimicrobiaceae bacterium]